MKVPARLNSTVFCLAFTAAALGAAVLSLPPVVRGALALSWLAVLGGTAGDALLPAERRIWRAYLGSLLVAALTMVVGSAAYYLADLSLGSVALVIAAVSGIVTAAHALAPRARTLLNAPVSRAETEPMRWHPVRLLAGMAAVAASLGLSAHAARLLSAAATDGSVRSPWDVVPRLFFVLVPFAAIAAVAAALGALAPRLSLLATAALALLSTGVAALVYKVGFGFDPFIHRATEATILAQGFIDPKPLYYVGQYALVAVVGRLTGADVGLIDPLLVPVGLALLVPTAYWSLRRALGFPPHAAAVAAVTPLLLPLSSFAATTPQGLANVIFLLAAFLALPAITRRAFPLAGLFVLAAASATIHPLAGVPLGMFVLLVALFGLARARRTAFAHGAKAAAALVAAVGAVALPAMFLLNAAVSGTKVEVDTSALGSATAIIENLQADAVATRQYSAAYDFAYAWKAWRGPVIALAAALGLLVAWRRARRRGEGGAGFVYAVGALMLLANYVLLKTAVRFDFLISYERSNYADRLLELTVFALAPLAAVAMAALAERAARHVPSVRIALALLLAASVTSSVYLAYPRRDKYEASRGWSTSASDVKAVRLIQDDAGGRKYVVLTNQSISAAAVREFGFPTYYPPADPKDPPIFYYPIPTGDPLYQTFLDANDDLGRRRTIEKAMDLAGVDTVYYVVSYYWWKAQEIILTAKRESDGYWNVDGKNHVFRYDR